MGFSDRLKAARIEKGYTQDQLANQIGIAKSTLSGYENGTREPDFFKIKKISEILKISADYLLETGQYTTPKKESKIELTEHELKVINAYRNQPSMQPAVDRLLGIDREDDRILRQSKEVMELSSMLDEEEIAKSKDPV